MAEKIGHAHGMHGRNVLSHIFNREFVLSVIIPIGETC
ncbi:MAG: hypothetical protein A4E55_00894 [Pelotomaculum sp. PtaU1.Bin035]|nr:MAG: hypothetical protein A4E55_00894 [Pelotomaculum sp. PtaU1.Bin035]